MVSNYERIISKQILTFIYFICEALRTHKRVLEDTDVFRSLVQ